MWTRMCICLLKMVYHMFAYSFIIMNSLCYSIYHIGHPIYFITHQRTISLTPSREASSCSLWISYQMQWRIAEVCQKIEHDFEILGVTAIEDKLQVKMLFWSNLNFLCSPMAFAAVLGLLRLAYHSIACTYTSHKWLTSVLGLFQI